MGSRWALAANWGMHYFHAPSRFLPIISACSGESRLAKPLACGKRSKPAARSRGDGVVAGMQRDVRPVPTTANRKSDITIDQFTDGLVKLAVDAIVHLPHHGDISIAMEERKTSESMARLADEKRLEWAKKIVADMGDRRPKDRTEVMAHETIYLHDRPEADMKLQAIRIGEFGIVALPNEVYAATTGMKIIDAGAR